MTKKSIGSFVNESGKFAISDPCYGDDVWCRGELENVKSGKWNAEVGMTDAGKNWGIRIALLIATHESYDEDAEGDLTETVAAFEVGVDSGQAGIFDVSHYRDDSVFDDSKPDFNTQFKNEDEPGEVWYGFCCDATLSDKRAGVIPFGVVSSSGFGDGGYSCTYYTDIDERIVKVVITFIAVADEDSDVESADNGTDNRKYTHCAKCGCELQDEYYMYRDNFLQVKYFDEPDGKDNAFCSESCAAEALMLESMENAKEE